MQINLTKPELVRLLRMAAIGDWVMHAALEADEENAEEVQAHKKVLQKLFAAADKAKLQVIAEHNREHGEYFETGEFEADFLSFVEKWEDERFWEMLADHLARRDLIEQYGEEAFKTMDMEQRAVALWTRADDYEKEFREHGLFRLQLLNASEKGKA